MVYWILMNWEKVFNMTINFHHLFRKLGIQQFLNGVSQVQLEKLLQKYDINGDGKISYEEFISFLLHPSPIKSANQRFKKPPIDKENFNSR